MNSETSSSLSPGQQLLNARKTKGMSLAHIAEATCILSARLEAIERDDYSAAGPAPAYVIGYVKSYAAQVNVDYRPLVKVIEAHFSEVDIPEQPKLRMDKTSGRIPWVPIVATFFAVAIFMALGQWFFVKEQSHVSVVDPDQLSSALNETSSESIYLSKEVSSNPSLTLSDSSSDVVEAVPSHALVQLEGQDAKTIAIENPSYVKDSDHESLSVTNVPANNLMERPHNATTPTPNENSSLESPDEVRLHFSDSCWLEVFDATRKSLASQLMSAGQHITLKGLAPFDVKVGNAQVATLEVNGRSVELNPPDGRRVLRLQVGP